MINQPARFPAGTPTPLLTANLLTPNLRILRYTKRGPARVHSQIVGPSLDTITLFNTIIGERNGSMGHGMVHGDTSKSPTDLAVRLVWWPDSQSKRSRPPKTPEC